MRAVVQRVRRAEVSVGGEVVGRIGATGAGLLVFLGVGEGDEAAEADWIAGRLAKLRVFDDAEGRMNRSIREAGGEVLVISQFTLFGSLRKGNRPSYNRAAGPDLAIPLYRHFIGKMESLLGREVPSGRFGEHMVVDAVNDGPVTLVIDSRQREF